MYYMICGERKKLVTNYGISYLLVDVTGLFIAEQCKCTFHKLKYIFKDSVCI